MSVDLLPDFTTSLKFVQSAFIGKSGHEEAVYESANHWIFEG
jgi:hypothetical protein